MGTMPCLDHGRQQGDRGLILPRSISLPRSQARGLHLHNKGHQASTQPGTQPTRTPIPLHLDSLGSMLYVLFLLVLSEVHASP